MHLKKVTLRNFRCFENLEVDLHPRLTVFVAENGGGKTAVLDGIAIGLSPILRSFSSANQRLSGPGIKDTDFRQESWEGRDGHDRCGASNYAQITMESTTGLQWDNWRRSAPGKHPEQKVGQSDLGTFASGILDSIKTSDPKLLPVFAYYGARRGWIVIPERLRETKVDYSHPTAALVGALESLSDFKEMLKWFDNAETSELRANKGRAPENYQSYPPLELVRSTVASILGNAYKDPHFNQKHKFVVTPKGGSGELQVSQLSQGYQSMLALGMDFARRLAIANAHLEHCNDNFDWSFARDYILQHYPDGVPSELTPNGPAWAPALMLIDEIDLHLHPSWQQRVLADLMRVFPCTQFIVTTHSPQVLSAVDKESIRIIRHRDDQWLLETPEFQTRGVESADVLSAIMGVDPVPQVDEAKWMNEYRALIENGTHESTEGQALRSRLTTHFGARHPLMLDCDRLIRFQAFKNRQPLPK